MGGRWHTFVDGFSCSAQEFYAAVDAAVRARQIPKLKSERFLAKEGAAFSAKREYLRIRRGRVAFDLCAAPFGGGFFFSWWRYRMPPAHPFLALLAVLAVVPAAGYAAWKLEGLLAAPVAVVAVVLVLGIAARNGVFGDDETILKLPIIGWLYERLFSPQTMYLEDAATMFEHVVGLVVREEINKLLTQQGLRTLSAVPEAGEPKAPHAA